MIIFHQLLDIHAFDPSPPLSVAILLFLIFLSVLWPTGFGYILVSSQWGCTFVFDPCCNQYLFKEKKSLITTIILT